MARTITEIENSILLEKSKHSVLDSLNSPSAVAIWRIWIYVQAVCIYEFEKIMDIFKAEIADKNSKAIVGRASWYAAKALEFQYGDSLTVVDGVVQYAVLDTSKQIIKRASCKGGVNAILKVATTDIGGNIVGLLPAQLDAFNDYVNNFMFAGTNLTVLSQNTDYLKLVANIYYNPLLFSNQVKTNVLAAINTHLSTLDFNGLLKVSALQDAIQAVEGVTDVQITTIQAKTNTGVYADVVRVYQTVAGYIQIDSVNFPLDTTITMIADES
jgi:hypothetical protein